MAKPKKSTRAKTTKVSDLRPPARAAAHVVGGEEKQAGMKEQLAEREKSAGI